MPPSPITSSGRRLPRLRTILIVLNVGVFLLLPLAFTVERTYDRQLIRQTESELLIQGTFVAEACRRSLAAAAGVVEPVPPRDPDAAGRTPNGDVADSAGSRDGGRGRPT